MQRSGKFNSVEHRHLVGMASLNASMNANIEVMDVIRSHNDKALIIEDKEIKGGFNGLSTGNLLFITIYPLSSVDLRDVTIEVFHATLIQGCSK